MNSAVIGLGFGDEGKGLVTDYLCRKDPSPKLVFRFSGGHQCGHNVWNEKTSHIFCNFGSGTLVDCPTYWSRYCTFEPIGFIKEYTILKEKKITPKIFIHPDCRVTTPFDITANWNSDEITHGTTGTGFFKTITRHKKIPLSVADLFYATVLQMKLTTIKDYYDGAPLEGYGTWEFNKAITTLQELIQKNIVVITDRVPLFENIIFEGSQGLLLDQNIGFFPHVTPSNIGVTNILEMGYTLDSVYLVTRAYQTRHGNGPMTNENLTLKIKAPKETNQENRFQGKFRTSVLDLDLLEYAVNKAFYGNHISRNIVVTCLDHLSNYSLTYKNELRNFKTRKEFISFIGLVLKIDGTLFGCDGHFSSCLNSI